MTHDTGVPEHITPKSIHEMTSDEIDAHLEGVRARRLQAAEQYEAAMQAAQEAADENARNQLITQCNMCKGNIERVDKAIDALEKRVNKIRALRLQLGLD